MPSSYRGDNSGRRKQWGSSQPPILFWEHSSFLRVLIRKIGYIFDNEKLIRQVGLETLVTAPTSLGNSAFQIPENRLPEVLKENPPIYFERNLRNMIAIAREHNIKIMFATFAYSPYFHDYVRKPYYQQGICENNEVVKKVTGNHKIPLFDSAAAMPKEKRYWADGRHVNEEGARKKASLFAEFIYKNKLIH